MDWFGWKLWCPVVGVILVINALTIAQEINRKDLYERLCFITPLQITTAEFAGTYRITKTPGKIPDSQLKTMLADREAELRRELDRGEMRFPDSYKLAMQKQFGTTDYRKLLGNPMVRQGLEQYLQDQLETYRTTLLHASADEYEEGQLQFLIDAERGGRLSRTPAKRLVNGEPDPDVGKDAVVITVNANTRKDYKPGRQSGYIAAGLSADRAKVAGLSGNPGLLRGGQAFVDTMWQAEDMKQAETVDTPEGKAVKVVFEQQTAPGVGNSTVLWVLLEKGYRVYRQEDYTHGELNRVNEFHNYKELEPGMWYPMQQRSEQYTSTIPDAIRARIKSGELTLSSEQVRTSQNSQLIRVEERQLTSVKPNIEATPSSFDQEFPDGTGVLDELRGKDSRHPLHYVVGTGAIQKEIQENIRKMTATSVAASSEPTPAAYPSKSASPSGIATVAAKTVEKDPRFNLTVGMVMLALFAMGAVGIWYRMRRS